MTSRIHVNRAFPVVLATSLLTVVASQNGCGGIRTKTVSGATIRQLPPDKNVEIDLTKKGTIYEFHDAGADFSRVSIRTSAGVKSFADLLKASNTSVRAGVVLGRPDDMRGHLPPLSGGTSQYDCGFMCKCSGQADCISLILSGKCSDDYWCSNATDNCFCTAKP
jgi:hypothetical protein